ncbi:MAG: hypothetical protein HF978_15885 [Desulfobacteraceae bacterium]|nr:zinc-ribbon domain-containing protein [Desulfobacteraceae bacterium]MBC2757023.1 hypothetical protein [Desulfobacteraceae bacterium]
MEIICNNCNSKLSVADDKLPEGKAASIRCPKCKNKISIDLRNRPENGNVADSVKPNSFNFDEGGDDYDASEKPFDFLEEEGKTALICENAPEIIKQINIVLGIMDYSVATAETVRDALKKMKYHSYDMMLINETFDGSDPDANGLLVYVERLSMDVRRNIFVGLLTQRFPTMDNMAAFLKSVNITINVKDIDSIDRILSRGINEYELFYATFRDSAKKLGTA